MNLKTYIKSERKITIGAAARELGVTRPYLSDVCNGKIRPGIKLAEGIQKWSNGEILAADLLRLTAA